MSKSCIGCKWLYKRDSGYSNWTVLETEVKCARGNNSNLPADEPYDWHEKADSDNWSATKESRCELFAPGPLVHLDCDGEVGPAGDTDDAEVIAVICKLEDIGPNGYESSQS